jgi:CheY-like chemotaxis protein
MKDCKNILVIDDDPAIRQTFQDVLEIYGYDVKTAVDGGEGIKSLNEMEAPPCLILLDLMMPGMNGWGFLDFQRENPAYAHVPVIICSAYSESAKSIGANNFLTKPVELSDLVGLVRNYCA